MTRPRRVGYVAVAAALAACATAAHVILTSRGFGYSGPLLVLDHLFDLVAVAALFWLFCGVGLFTVTRCGGRFERAAETLAFSVAMGAGVVASLILICGLTGGLRLPVLGGMLAALAWVVRSELRAVPALVAEATAVIRAGSPLWSMIVTAGVIAFMVSQALAPPLDWDSLMYHVRVPAQFVAEGRIHAPEDNDTGGALTQLAHMTYVPLLAVGSDAGPALVSVFFAVVLGLSVFAFCDRFIGAAAGYAVPFLWGTAMIPLVAISPRVDVTLALYLFLAHYALLLALTQPRSGPAFYASAVMLGMAGGIKYLGLVYVAALGPLVLWIAFSRFSGLARARALALFGVLGVLAALPWLAKNWLLYEAPFYPYFSPGRAVPWIAAISRGEPIQPLFSLGAWQEQVSERIDLLTLIVTPGRVTVENEAALYSMSPIWLLLPMWLLFVRDRVLTWLMVPAIGFVGGVLWYLPSNSLRYLIPAVPPLTIVATAMFCQLQRRLPGRRAAAWATVLAASLAVLPAARNLGVWLTGSKSLAYLAGAASKEEYLRTARIPAGSDIYSEMVLRVNRTLPRGSRLLLLFDARGYYFDVPVIQDNTLQNWPLVAGIDRVNGCLSSTGISHVLVNVGALSYYVSRGLDRSVLRLDELKGFIDRCLLAEYARGGFVLYRVRAFS